MLTHALITEYLRGGNLTAAINHALDEASVGQLRKQKPWLKPIISYLRDQKKIDDKYIPWMITHLEADFSGPFNKLKQLQDKPDYADYTDVFILHSPFVSHVLQLEGLAKRFEQASQAKKFDKALKVGLLKNQRVKDITFWTKMVKTKYKDGDALEVLDDVLKRLDLLRSRKDIKTQEADLIYKDDRFSVYSPLSHEASCQLGAGTKWCIASRSSDYYEDYTAKGKRFVFIMDAAGDDDFYKIAIVYDLFGKRIEDYFNAPDHSVGERRVEGAIGDDNWQKIKAKILDYMKDQEPELARAEGDIWAGDEVVYDTRFNDHLFYKVREDVEQYWLDPSRFEHIDSEVLQHSDLVKVVVDALYEIYEGAEGIVTGPTRTNFSDNEPYVTVEGTFGEDSTDWDEVLNDYFPIAPKPENPLKKAGKQQWLPGMAKTIADDYQAAMNDWLEAQKPREEFKDEVVDSFKGMSGDKWYEDEIYAGELRVTNEIDPKESVAKYGPVD